VLGVVVPVERKRWARSGRSMSTGRGNLLDPRFMVVLFARNKMSRLFQLSSNHGLAWSWSSEDVRFTARVIRSSLKRDV